MSNVNFGKPFVTTVYAPEVLLGWGVRPYQWQGSASMQHELWPGVAVNVGYFRTWYGNFIVTDNLDVTPVDYDPYSITVPVDPRLPGGGGNVLSGFYDISTAKFGSVHNLIVPASTFGNRTQVFNGIDAISQYDRPTGIFCASSVRNPAPDSATFKYLGTGEVQVAYWPDVAYRLVVEDAVFQRGDDSVVNPTVDDATAEILEPDCPYGWKGRCGCCGPFPLGVALLACAAPIRFVRRLARGRVR